VRQPPFLSREQWQGHRPCATGGGRGPPTYADGMTFLIIVTLIVAAVVAYKMRVQLLAKILGQPERRIERRLNRPK
jgi:hypothetical protein